MAFWGDLWDDAASLMQDSLDGGWSGGEWSHMGGTYSQYQEGSGPIDFDSFGLEEFYGHHDQPNQPPLPEPEPDRVLDPVVITGYPMGEVNYSFTGLEIFYQSGGVGGAHDDPSQPNAPCTSNTPVTNIYVGGAGDSESLIVKSFVDSLSGDNNQYFSHDQLSEIVAALAKAGNDGHRINVIGHSWGADTAAAAAKDSGVPIDSLIGIDPVSKPGWDLFGNTGRGENVREVIRVDADGSGTGSDWVSVGGQIIGGGEPAAYGDADVNIEVNASHEEFAKLLQTAGDDGKSAANFIENC